MPSKPPRWMEYQPVRGLVPDDRNPKDHDAEELRASLGRWGYTMPVMVDERTGKLVAGHGRRTILLDDEEKGATPPEGIVIGETGWEVPVIRGWRSKNDDEALAWVVADNELPGAGGWVLDRLADVMQQIQQSAGGLAGTGYSADAVSDLLARMGKPASLDDLAGQLGPPKPDDFWPTLRFKVSPADKTRFDALVQDRGLSSNDTEQFVWLLEVAEAAPRRRRTKKAAVEA